MLNATKKFIQPGQKGLVSEFKTTNYRRCKTLKLKHRRQFLL